VEGRKTYFSLRSKITVLVFCVVALALLVTYVLISKQIAENTQKNLAQKATDISRVVANSTVVIEALNGQRSESEIQLFTEKIRNVTHVEYIVVMDVNGIRKSHSDVTKIGHHFVGGDEDDVFNGKEYVSYAEGTLGQSLRSFTPIYSPEGKQIGAVAVGILLDSIKQAVDISRTTIYLAVGLGFLVGAVGAIVLARNIKKTLFGLEPFAIAKLLEERSAMLQAVREGIIAVDKKAQITLVNGEARRLLNQAGIKGNPLGQNVELYVPNSRLHNILVTGIAEVDQEQDMNGITLLTNRVPVSVSGEIVGAIATFRDKTEMQQLAEELTGVRSYAEALRAKTHEFMNKLHVILGLVRLESYDQLANYVSQIAQQYQDEVGYVIRRIKNPIFAGFLLGKLSRAREAGTDLVISEDSFLPDSVESEIVHALVTIVGNLIDNAFEAIAGSSLKRIDVSFVYNNEVLFIEVSDTGIGIPVEEISRIFLKGYSTKADNRGWGLFLVQQNVEKLKGRISVVSEVGVGTKFMVTLPYLSKGEAND